MLCPHCSGPRCQSRPGALCCVTLPLSVNLFPITSSAALPIKAKSLKMYKKIKIKKRTGMLLFNFPHLPEQYFPPYGFVVLIEAKSMARSKNYHRKSLSVLFFVSKSNNQVNRHGKADLGLGLKFKM